MARGPAPPTDADLLILDEFLLSDRSPEHAMCICDLDGFLTGVIAGPELIVPSEWMPTIWGGGGPVFDSMEETSAILGTIMRRYNEILTNLEAGPESFNPIFENARGGIAIVTDWAAGFIDAAKLRAEKWEALIRDDEMASVFYPLLLLGAEDDEHPPFGAPPASAEAMDELYRAAPAIITECVYRIYAFWRRHDTRPAPKARRRRGRTAARTLH